jgi:hypothetical protein
MTKDRNQIPGDSPVVDSRYAFLRPQPVGDSDPKEEEGDETNDGDGHGGEGFESIHG